MGYSFNYDMYKKHNPRDYADYTEDEYEFADEFAFHDFEENEEYEEYESDYDD